MVIGLMAKSPQFGGYEFTFEVWDDEHGVLLYAATHMADPYTHYPIIYEMYVKLLNTGYVYLRPVVGNVFGTQWVLGTF
jgi:hypothetical protein